MTCKRRSKKTAAKFWHLIASPSVVTGWSWRRSPSKKSSLLLISEISRTVTRANSSPSSPSWAAFSTPSSSCVKRAKTVKRAIGHPTAIIVCRPCAPWGPRASSGSSCRRLQLPTKSSRSIPRKPTTFASAPSKSSKCTKSWPHWTMPRRKLMLWNSKRQRSLPLACVISSGRALAAALTTPS